jgi:hypothetical protein
MYCLGLSRDHDAVLLNKMAQCGSALGNFIYLDIYDGKYEKVTEAFQDSMSIVLANSGKPKLTLSRGNE